ncbi:DUF3471 domain-containing protein [Lysobacter enzymogenes]|nr:DUF3471 domain-containing protein [Lysobacter enzymogenes]
MDAAGTRWPHPGRTRRRHRRLLVLPRPGPCARPRRGGVVGHLAERDRRVGRVRPPSARPGLSRRARAQGGHAGCGLARPPGRRLLAGRLADHAAPARRRADRAGAGAARVRVGLRRPRRFLPAAVRCAAAPLRGADGRYGFVWNQGGGSVAAQRSAPAATSVPAEAGSSKAVPSKAVPFKAASAKAAPAPATQRLGDFVGDYPLAPGFVLSIGERDGALYAQATGQGALRLLADGADGFRTEGVDARIAFERGSDGKIAGLTLHQNGQAIHAPRR